MKKTLLIVVILVISFFGGTHRPAFGAGLRGDGNELLEACSLALNEEAVRGLKSNDDTAKANFCIGFVDGFARSVGIYEAVNTHSGSPNKICLPEASLWQYVRVVHKFLQDHPEKLHRNEGVLVFDALKESFPCPKK